MQPLFIAFEGIDGSGKSTQAKLLAEKMSTRNLKTHLTFEPTDSDIGKMIREIFAGKREGDQKVIAALFGADRLHHILEEEKGLLARRNNEEHIITDRYYLSSYAYHGAHVDMDWVMDINAQAVMLLKPDIHIYIDIDPEVSLKRIKANREHIEMYETLENLRVVYDKYEEAFAKVRKVENIKRIDGNRTQDEVAIDVWNVVQRLF